MTQTFICFYCLNNVTEEREVSSRTAPIIDIPFDAYAYNFYDRTVVKAEDGELCYGLERNESPMTYIDCIHFTLDNLKGIVEEMEVTGDKAVVITSLGEVYPCEPDAKLVSRFELEELL